MSCTDLEVIFFPGGLAFFHSGSDVFALRLGPFLVLRPVVFVAFVVFGFTAMSIILLKVFETSEVVDALMKALGVLLWMGLGLFSATELRSV